MFENVGNELGARVDKTMPRSMQPHNEDYFLNQNNLDVLVEEQKAVLKAHKELEGMSDEVSRKQRAELEDKIVHVGHEIAEFTSRTAH